MTSIQCGEVEAVHKITTENVYKQQLVEVKGQTDILTMGIPFISPYNVNSVLNPILVDVHGPRVLLQHVPWHAAGARGRRRDHDPPDVLGVQPGAPSELHRLLRAGAGRHDGSRARSRRSTRSSSPRTSGTATCTARGTPTTACTRSTCGTGRRTAWHTWGGRSSSVVIRGRCAGSGFTPASTMDDALEMATDVVGSLADDHPPPRAAADGRGRELRDGSTSRCPSSPRRCATCGSSARAVGMRGRRVSVKVRRAVSAGGLSVPAPRGRRAWRRGAGEAVGCAPTTRRSGRARDPAKVARRVIREGPMRLAVQVLADPEMAGVDRLADLRASLAVTTRPR